MLLSLTDVRIDIVLKKRGGVPEKWTTDKYGWLWKKIRLVKIF